MNIDFGGGFLIFLVATLWILVAHFWWQKFGGETNFFGGGMYLNSFNILCHFEILENTWSQQMPKIQIAKFLHFRTKNGFECFSRKDHSILSIFHPRSFPVSLPV